MLPMILLMMTTVYMTCWIASAQFVCICEGAVMSTVVCAGYLLFKEYCESIAEEPVPQMSFYDEVSCSYS